MEETWYRGSGYMPEELCQVSSKSHYVSLALHSDPSPYDNDGDCDGDSNMTKTTSLLIGSHHSLGLCEAH